MRLVDVAVDFPKAESLLVYGLEDGRDVAPGELVEVPLARRKGRGCVIGKREQLPSGMQASQVKSIGAGLGEQFDLSPQELALFQWSASYYHYSLGKLIFDCLPKMLKRPRQIRWPVGLGLDLPHRPNPVQAEIWQKMKVSLGQGFSQHLLHGVTGSGKTLIYLHLMKEVLGQGQSVHFLLPEINLTPQFLKTLGDYLSCPIIAYHSALSASERLSAWLSAKQTGPVCVVGVRSSVFLPLDNLGLIIVDEEHDSSFKQKDRCPYNARDVAIKKAQLQQFPIVLGSATPMIETQYRLQQVPEKKAVSYYRLPERVDGGKLPQWRLLDERQQKEAEIWPFLPETLTAIGQRLEKKEQVLVFANRLGFSRTLQCRACGHRFENDLCGCGLALRFFKQRRELKCTQCDFHRPVPDQCPACGNLKLSAEGFGTERLEGLLSRHFPHARVGRFDRDEISTLAQLEDTLNAFHSGAIDIMVGTQMLSKGHNFENVNLVVILGADQQLNFPDFRATERTFQMLTQVAGRAGRFSQHGEVWLQTLNPDNPLYQWARHDQWDEFYASELFHRQASQCPPFCRLTALYFLGPAQERVAQAATAAAQDLALLREKNPSLAGLQLLGPSPALLEKRQKTFTWKLLLKAGQVEVLRQAVSWLQGRPLASQVQLRIDVDPYTLL